jgi:hypothetical protein
VTCAGTPNIEYINAVEQSAEMIFDVVESIDTSEAPLRRSLLAKQSNIRAYHTGSFASNVTMVCSITVNVTAYVSIAVLIAFPETPNDNEANQRLTRNPMN